MYHPMAEMLAEHDVENVMEVVQTRALARSLAYVGRATSVNHAVSVVSGHCVENWLWAL